MFIWDVLTWPLMWHCSTLLSCTIIATECHIEVIFQKDFLKIKTFDEGAQFEKQQSLF